MDYPAIIRNCVQKRLLGYQKAFLVAGISLPVCWRDLKFRPAAGIRDRPGKKKAGKNRLLVEGKFEISNLLTDYYKVVELYDFIQNDDSISLP